MNFSIRQLQEKCREQNMPLYISFIDLTKAFDLVSRDGLFNILTKIACQSKIKVLLRLFITICRVLYNMMGMCLNLLKLEMMSSKVPTIIEIFFSLLLKHPFDTAEEGIYLHTRTDGRLFKPSRLKTKTKVKQDYYKIHAVCRRCRSSSTQPITASIFDGSLY